MSKFRWAYIDCAESGGGSSEHLGPSGSVQFKTGSLGATNGSANLRFFSGTNTLELTGTLSVSGTIRANTLDIITTVQTEIDVSGSTNFGDSNDDTHSFTGSMYVGRAGETPAFIVDNATGGQRVETKGFRAAYRQIATSGLTSSNGDYILGVRGSGNLELRIHSAVSAKSGSLLVIKDELVTRAGIITLSASSGQTIDGDGYYQISGSSPAINLYSNGVNGWYVF